MNKTSRGDGILAELSHILKDIMQTWAQKKGQKWKWQGPSRNKSD